MPSVQFFGADNVIKAAENRKCPAWAIFQGKQFLFKYEGSDLNESQDFLEKILENLQDSVSVYTIRFYEEAVKIKENTPYDGSFNFRMLEEEQRQQRNAMYATGSREVLNRLEAIEEKLSGKDEEEGDEETIGGIGGIVVGLLKEPEKLAQLISIGKSLLGITPKQPMQPAAAISGIDVSGPGSEAEKIQTAVAVLQRNDPQIGDHLTKLAYMSENDKATFKYLLSMLDKM